MSGYSRRTGLLAASILYAALAAPIAQAADLKIGMRADPDILDPAQGGSVAGRLVFASLCDKLIDTTPEGGFRPQLATEWEWSNDNRSLTMHLRPEVKFHDGTMLDAEAVKINIDRYRTDPISRRQTELKSIDAVEVVDPLTVRIDLAQADAPLVAALADRAGMIMSPKALEAAGENIGLDPVCAGPFKFVERVAQDYIKLEKFDDYWNSGEIFLDGVTFLPIPDDSVRLLSLRSGDLDMIERVSPTDINAVEEDPNLTLVRGPSVAYDLISINVAHTDQANNPLGQDERVRKALELSIDRNALNQIVYDGLFVPSNQHEVPGSQYYDATNPVPERDVEAAKALLAAAGIPNPSFTLTVANSPVSQQVGQIVQSMAAESGFDVKLEALESSTMASRADAGDYQASLVIWSGRPDPDANVAPWASCDGFLNWGKFCDPALDEILKQARQTTDPAARSNLYRQAVALYTKSNPHIILYHYTSLFGLRNDVTGFAPFPDSLIRLQGVKKSG
ncbi:MAG: ABC transporter substrate-binding protein [Paracoccaceae bacterium]